MDASDEQSEKFELIQTILSYLGKKERYEEYIADFKRKTEEAKKKHKAEASALLDHLKKIELDVQAVRAMVGDVTLKELVAKQADLKEEIKEQKGKYTFLKNEIERLTLYQNWFKFENDLKSYRKQEIELLLTKRSLNYLIQQPQKTGDCWAQFKQMMQILFKHILFEPDLQTLSETTNQFKKKLNDAIQKSQIALEEQKQQPNSKNPEKSLQIGKNDKNSEAEAPKLTFLQEKYEFFKKSAEDPTSSILENPLPSYLNLDPVSFAPLVSIVANTSNPSSTNVAEVRENLIRGHLFEYFLPLWLVNDCIYPMFGKYIRDVFAEALTFLMCSGSNIGQTVWRGLRTVVLHQWDWLKESAAQNKADSSYKDLETMTNEIEAQLATNLDKNLCWKLFICRALNANSLSKWFNKLLIEPNDAQKKVNNDYFPIIGESLIFKPISMVENVPQFGKKANGASEDNKKVVTVMNKLIFHLEDKYPKMCLSTDPNPDHLNFALKWEKSQQQQ